MIRIWRPVAPRSPVGLSGGGDGGRFVVFGKLDICQHVVRIGLMEGIAAAFGSLPDIIEAVSGFCRGIAQAEVRQSQSALAAQTGRR